MKLLFAFLCCYLSIYSTQGNPNFRPGKDVALFFINSKYGNRYNLNYKISPELEKGAKKIQTELQDKFGFQTFEYLNYSKEEIFDCLLKWQEETFKTDAQLFIYFSGKSDFNNLEQKGYYLASPKEGTNENQPIEIAILENLVTKIPCKHVLLLFDGPIPGASADTINADQFRGRRNNFTIETQETIIKRQLRNQTKLLLAMKRPSMDAGFKDGLTPFAHTILARLEYAYKRGDYLVLLPDLLSDLSDLYYSLLSVDLYGHEEGGFVFQVTDEARRTLQKIRTIQEKFESAQDPRELPFIDDSFLPLDSSLFEDKSQLVKDRDGNYYPYRVLKDGNTWMMRDLNVKMPGSYCYDDKEGYCTFFGRLYIWEAAIEACKTLGKEWRLPSDKEWKALTKAYGGYIVNARRIGSPKTAYYNLYNGGPSQFNGLLGGYRFGTSYKNLGKEGQYWTSTERSKDYAWYFLFSNVTYAMMRGSTFLQKTDGLSVRCVKGSANK